MVSGVILNWKRPGNVVRILDSWRTGGLVHEAIVWNNNPGEFFPAHDWAKVVNASPDLGLYTRFSAACLAQHECVLMQDDDLLIPPESLRQLHDAWRAEPDRLHGVFGREPKPDGTYARDVRADADVSIVLTRVLLFHRRYAAEFFRQLSRFEKLQVSTRPFGNGEDIILSYVVRWVSGKLNRVHRVKIKELPAPHAIHARGGRGHVAHRTRLMQACEEWLKGDKKSSGGPILRSVNQE